MEAGVSDHVWSIEEIISLCPERDAGFVSKMKHFSGAIDPALRETADAGSSSTTT